MGVDSIGLIILGICVILFLTKWIPACVTGVIGCLLMVLFNVCTYEEAFSGFSSSIVLLMASVMIVGIAMFKTGVANIIGKFAVRISRRNEKRFLIAMCVLGGLLAMFFANTAIIAVFIPIIDSVVEESEGKIRRLPLVLPMAMAVMIGGSATLVGCTPQLAANALMSKLTGTEMTMWSLTGPALCIFALYLAYIIFFGYRFGSRIFAGRLGNKMETDHEDRHDEYGENIDRKKVIIMSVILVLMVVSYMVNIIPAAYTAMICAILCIVTGCCSVRNVVKDLNWETVVFLASCLGIAEALTVSGAGDTVGELVSHMLGDVNQPLVLFAVIVLMTMLLSQFITNSTAIIISLPIGLSLCGTYGMNYMPFCIGITLAASLACCTPLAAAQITMTQMAGYEFSDYVKYGIWPSLIMYLGIILFVPLFYPLVG